MLSEANHSVKEVLVSYSLNECKTILTSVKENLNINIEAGLYEDEEVEYWRTRYENMRDLYVNAVERLAKYDKKEVTTTD